MKKPIDVCDKRKMYLSLWLFLTLLVNLCHGNKDKIGIIYDVSTEFFPSVTEEQLNGFSDAPPTQIYWLLMNSSNPTNVLGKVRSFLGSGIHVLISQLRCPQLTLVSAMTEILQIPHLALNIDTCRLSRNKTYTIRLEYQFSYLPKMIISIAELESWKKVIFVMNNKFVQRYAQRFIQELSKAGIESVLWDGADIKPWTEQQQIVFIAKNLSSIQQMVISTQLIPRRRSWIALSREDVTSADLAQMGSILPRDSLLIRPKDPCSQSQSISFCNNTGLKFLAKQLLRMLPLRASSGPGPTFSIPNNMTNTDDGEEPFCVGAEYLSDWIKQKRRLLRESKTQITKDVCSEEFELLKQSEDLKSIQVAGEWTPTEGLSKYGYTRSPVKKDCEGIILRVGIMGAAFPFSYDTVGENNTYQGFMIDILDQVAFYLNFRYVLVESDDGFYGHTLDNGTWTGIVGMIHREEIVFGAGLFTVNTERSEVVDFTTPYMESSFAILTSIVKGQPGIFQFVKPFSTKVWVLIIIFGITSSIALVNMSGLTEHKCKANNQMSPRMDIVFDVISAFLEQGVQSWPRSSAARCLLAFWFIFSLLIVAIYTARLTAVLTVSTPVKHIESLKDLSERTDLEVIALKGSSEWMLFQSSKEPVYQKIFSRMTASSDTQEEILRKVMSGKACYISDTIYLQYHVALACGQVRIAEDQFNQHSLAFPIQKNSPFKETISFSLQKMMEAGFIDLLKKKWLDRRFNCNQGPHKGATIDKLNINRLWGVFLMFLVFVALAVLACIVQRILFHAINCLDKCLTQISIM